MSNEIFADGIGEIGFGGGAIRLDFYKQAMGGLDETGKPRREICQRVVMTPIGFLEAFSTMQGMIDKLVENGVLQRNPPPEAAAPRLAPTKAPTRV